MLTVAELIDRDGAVCVWCGREVWPADLTAEHLLPRTRGGHSTPENLAVACRRCNRARGARSVAAYVRTLAGDGVEPQLERLCAALSRLSASPRRAHAGYGARQLALLRALAAQPAERRSRTFT
ncbi:MAG TPA: HNH endonuclease [Solirubrobacteraceae bacterium]|nr:HNH endonuclease [Solirubrobacteraceae bacterium]